MKMSLHGYWTKMDADMLTNACCVRRQGKVVIVCNKNGSVVVEKVSSGHRPFECGTIVCVLEM